MAKIIEAKAVISGEEKLSPLLDKLAKKFDQVQKSAKTSGEVDKMAAALGRVKTQVEAIEKFNASKIGFAAAREKYVGLKKQVEDTARAMRQGSGNAAELEGQMRRQVSAVQAASRAFERQKAALLGSSRELRAMGVPMGGAIAHQQRLAAAVDRANAAMERQRRWGRRISGAQAAGGMLGGALVGSRSAFFARRAIESAASFDIGTRQQRVFNDINAADQADILTPQAKRIGQETQFTNLDVVKAQTVAMQGLPSNITGRLKAEVGAGIMENVKNYALMMRADLETSAEAVRTFLQSANKDISTQDKALAESNKAVNQLVKMAKAGGMNAEDVQGYLTYAVPSATAAGISPETAMTVAALARRGGLRGDVAGVFMRTAASKLVAPTKKGLTALNSAGINYSDFVHMPDRLDVNRLEGQFGMDTGTKFTPRVRAQLEKALADKGVIGDRAKFTQTVTDIVAEQFPKTKKGKISAADRQKIAKSAGAFYKTSAASVDAQGLLDRIMMSDMSLAQLNAFFTDKHGGKFAITRQQREQYIAERKSILEAGDDPDFAKRKADEIMGGLGGSFERLKGSVETLTLEIGNAWEGTLKPAFEGIGGLMDYIANIPKPVLAAGSGAVAIGSVGVGAWLLGKLAGGFGLTGSAVALDGAAAALTAAATALGGGAVATGAKAAAGGAAAAASPWAARVATAVPFLGPAGLAVGGAAALYGLRQYVEGEGYAGKTVQERLSSQGGGSMRDVRIRAFNEDRERMGLPLLGDNGPRTVEAELKGKAEVSGKAEVTINIPSLGVHSVTVPLRGTLNANGPGSLGVSTPDAAAAPVGAR